MEIFEFKHGAGWCGAKGIEQELRQGINVFELTSEEVKNKYEHLVSHHIPTQQSQQ